MRIKEIIQSMDIIIDSSNGINSRYWDSELALHVKGALLAQSIEIERLKHTNRIADPPLPNPENDPWINRP